MGKPGAFSKKLSFNSLTSTLREDYEMCDSVQTINYHINDAQFLKLLDGRYYYDKKGQMKLLNAQTDTDLIGKVLPFRSPCTCNSKDGVCRYCYGHMFNINQGMFSPGTLAALKITEPIGQGILSSKHSQSTHSNELHLSEGYEDVFETQNSQVMLKENSDLDADLYLRLGNVEIDEMDDSEYYHVSYFDLVDSKGQLIRHVEELSGAQFYLNDHLIQMYKQKTRTKMADPIFSLEDVDDEEPLFTIEVKNKELTEPLKIFTKVLNSKEHGGAKTLTEFCQIFAEKLIQMGIKYEFVHAEMVLRALIRKKSNVFEFPDFGLDSNPNDFQIMKLNDAQFNHPSVLVSMPYGYLRRALMSPELYEKTATGPLDSLYVSRLSDYL